jgi:hypothetical protein
MNLNKIVWATHDEENAHPRRDFLRKTLLLTALPLGAAMPFASLRAATLVGRTPSTSGECGLKATGAATYQAPTRARGGAVRNVRDYGALGNGSHDDTTAFQNAINSLPSDGGTVVVPAGNYKIDAVRSVKLRSRMHLKMDPDAKLIAKATSSDKYNVLLCEKLDDLEISGGQIIGERDSHQGTGGESGHGLNVRGCDRVTIRGVRVSKCWGDGISIGPKPMWKAPLVMSRDVAVVGVTCVGNRRNAFSITNAINVDVWDSEFSDTRGTTPQSGVDVEPNKDEYGSNDYCDKIHFENCIMSGNAQSGIVIWNRARGVTVKNCVMQGNGTSGIFTEGANNVLLVGNSISRSGSNGAAIRKNSSNFDIYNNTFYQNYTKQGLKSRNPAFYLTGTSPKVERDIIVTNTGRVNVVVGKNYYR